ncbi:hypothetical protein O3P69_000076 [Scylla paramamosain]|uniref:BHLH domain-containing protein n=2 Tax=Scylla paramamosain TaxID=85552 RepID=A0AAW0UZD3_SCYPA
MGQRWEDVVCGERRGEAWQGSRPLPMHDGHNRSRQDAKGVCGSCRAAVLPPPFLAGGHYACELWLPKSVHRQPLIRSRSARRLAIGCRGVGVARPPPVRGGGGARAAAGRYNGVWRRGVALVGERSVVAASVVKMSLVGGYSMPQSYGHTAMGGATPSPEALYSPYYSHPSPPAQALYPGWGYSASGYSSGFPPEVAVACPEYGVSAGFVMGPGSPHDLGGDYTIEMVDGCGRVVKRRSSANKKERRRTQSINNAFAELRECIPNVPADTKLSKIKTLRLATSYIAYLMEVLHGDDGAAPAPPPPGPFPPAAPHQAASAAAAPHQAPSTTVVSSSTQSPENDKITPPPAATSPEPKRGRTGWPQEVWAQELKK